MKRNRSLDVLRGVVVLLVIGHHPYFPIWYRALGDRSRSLLRAFGLFDFRTVVFGVQKIWAN